LRVFEGLRGPRRGRGEVRVLSMVFAAIFKRLIDLWREGG
jgi:hypothetical protein